MSKSTHLRQSRGFAHAHTDPVTSKALPLRRTWPISLCVGLALGSIVFSGEALAGGPTGGTVVGGVGSITQSGNSTIINQASQKLALNWQTFNVGANESVLFNQPSSSAVALNRILDQNPSQIFGRINSNGQIFLINTHGIIFGATAQLNVGGLLASTLDLTPNDFLAGHYNLNVAGAGAGIVNHGLIQAASGGSVALVGGSVLNDGLIFANYGKINLDGADHAVLDFDGNGLINIQITGELKQRLDQREAAVTNKGTLRAEDGTVVLQASATKDLFTSLVNNTGIVDARGINTDGGVVRLVGTGGNVESSGSINVSGAHGGSVQLLSDRNVGVTGGSIDASGTLGGGSIRVGGGWQGGEGLQTAAATYVAPDAVLRADATQQGDGGSVVVWGNDVNNFYGSISARGGALGGNGGRVETSSLYGLNVQGHVDASAPNGTAGLWLLDPRNVEIVTGGGGTLTGGIFSAPAANSTIDPGVIGSALTGGTSVSIYTGTGGGQNGDITVTNGITATGAGTLYLKAAGSILLNDGISSDGSNALNVNLWANYGGTAAATSYSSNAACATCVVTIGNAANAAITTFGGAVDIRTGDATHAGGGLKIGNGTFIGSINTSGAASARGALTVNATGIAQLSAVGNSIVAGQATLSAGNSGTISLLNTGNAFSGPVSLTGGSVSLVNGQATVLGTTTASSLDVGSNGAISQNGALTVTGLATFTQNNTTAGATQDIDLGSQNNSLRGGVTFAAGAGAGINNLSLKNTWATPGALTLPASVDGDLTLNYTAAALAVSAIGVGGALDVTASGGITIGGNITSAGAQTYHSAVALGGDITLSSNSSDVNFASTVDNASATARNLTVNAGNGAVTFGGAVGGGANGALAGLTTNSGTFSAGALNIGSGGLSVTTTAGGITQGGAFTVTGASSFNAGANAITLANAGNAFTGPVSLVGGSVSLANGQATVLGTTTASSLDVGSNGAISQSGALTVTGLATFTQNNTTAGATQDIDLGSQNNSLRGGVTFAAGAGAGINNLSLKNTWATPGALTLPASVAGMLTLNYTSAALTVPLASTTAGGLDLTAGGGITINGNITTAGAQTYRSAVTLGADATLASSGNGNIGFAATVDGAHALTVNTGGATSFGGAVGGTTALTSLATDAGGSTVLGGNVTTSGAQTYGDAVTLGGNVTLATTNSSVGFGSTVDNASATARNLTVNAGSGAVTFGGAVGGGANGALGALSVNSTGITNFNAAVKAASLATDAGGGTVLGGNATTSGTQTYNDMVTLGGNATLTGTTVSLAGVTGAGNNLTVSGNAVLSGAVTGLSQLQVSGTTALNTASVNTTGGQSYAGAVTLGADTTLASSGNGNISFGSTLDGAHALTVNTGGATSFGGAVGGTTALTGLSTDVGGSTVLGGNVTTSGDQVYYDAVTLGTDVTLGSTGGVVYFVSTLDGAHALTVNAPVAWAAFAGDIGSTTALTSLTVGAGGSIYLGGNVKTGGAQTYGNAVLLYGATPQTLTGSDVHFSSTLDGVSTGAQALTVNASGVTGFGGAVGGTVALASLSTDAGGGTTLGGNVTTTGAQTYGDTVTLGGNATLTGTTVSLAGVTGATHDLTVAGNAVLGGAVAGVNALQVSGTTALNTASVSTTGGQSYTGAVTLGADATLTSSGSGNIGFGSTVDGAHALTVNTGGGASFGGAVGGATALTRLSINSGTFSANALTINGPLSVTAATGGITQGGGFKVTGASSFNAGSGTITLTNAGNDFAGVVNLTGGATQITSANALTLGTLATGALTAVSHGALNLGAGSIGGNLAATSNNGAISQTGALNVSGTSNLNAGNGAITLSNAGNHFAGAMTLAGAGVQVVDAGNLTVAALTNGANGAVSLVAGGTLTLPAGAINTGSANLVLASNGGALSTPGDLSGHDISLTANGGLTLSNNVNATGTLSLTSGAGISQSAGIITAGTLTGSSVGNTTLGQANLIGTLGSFSAANFSLINAQALTVNGPLTTTGNSGDVALTTTSGTLAVNTGLVGHAVALNSAGDLALANDITGGTVTLGSGGSISQSGGTLTAGTLNGSAVGSATLGRANKVTTLGSFSADGFSLVNSQALAVNGPINGGSSVALTTTAGGLAINGALSGATTTLQSAGAISEGAGGSITANLLTGHSAGTTTLNGVNHINQLGSFSADFSLTNGQTLTVVGPLVGGPVVSLTTTAGDLIINGAVSGTTTTLTSAGAISEGAGGSITAATLSGQSAGATTLNGSNHIGTLGSFTAAGFTLTNAQALAVGGPVNGGASTSLTTTAGDLAINGTVSGTTTTLKSAGAISEGAGGSITATTLSGQSAGATALNGSNRVGTLGSFTATGFALTNAQALTVGGPVNGGASTALTTTAGDLAINGAVSGTTTTLKSAGAISEGASGSITAGTLSGQSGGATTLNGVNHIGTLGSFSAANFGLTNAQALTVVGPVNGGNSTALTTTAGDLLINGAVSGNQTTLKSAGAISEGTGGVITASTLSGSAVGTTMLGGPSQRNSNLVSTLGNFSSPAGFSMTNNKTLTLASVAGSAFTVNAGTSAFYLSVTNGDLFQLGTTPVYNGMGVWGSTGRMGTGAAPIYVVGTGLQTIANIGLPPAYFYAVDSSGNLLPLGGGLAVNVPTASGAGSAQNGNHGDSYIDPSVITANYRSYGIVPSGVRLPADQQGSCDPDQPDQPGCEGGDTVGMVGVLMNVRR
ncbi:MAG: filamentous hemagglutinin N-terminal domain-containing protein [Rhodanobacter sp.]